VAVFVHGCFWHRHEGCRYAATPKTRPEFWAEKFAATVARDQAVCDALDLAGWRVATVWACALRKPDMVETATTLLAVWQPSDLARMEIGENTDAR